MFYHLTKGFYHTSIVDHCTITLITCLLTFSFSCDKCFCKIQSKVFKFAFHKYIKPLRQFCQLFKYYFNCFYKKSYFQLFFFLKVEPQIDSKILVSDTSLAQRQTRFLRQFIPLNASEIQLDEDNVVGIDAEFVTLNQVRLRVNV